jgi:hypothetical protein
MKKSIGSSPLSRASAVPVALPALAGAADAAASEGTSRRAFLQATAGAAAGAAAILATPKVVSALDAASAGAGAAAEPKAVVTAPSGRPPREPVTAYVRNAERHEVTVLSGTRETTYKDPALVKRLLDAAR